MHQPSKVTIERADLPRSYGSPVAGMMSRQNRVTQYPNPTVEEQRRNTLASHERARMTGTLRRRRAS